MRQLLLGTRYLVLLAILGILLAAISSFAYGAICVGKLIVHSFGSAVFDHDGARRLSIETTEFIDLFLLGTVLYIVAMGLYQLFIDDKIPMPKWLTIESIDDLKTRLIGVVIVLLAVTFLGDVVDWEKGQDIMALGFGIASVMIALTLVLWLHHRSSSHQREGGVSSEGSDR